MVEEVLRIFQKGEVFTVDELCDHLHVSYPVLKMVLDFLENRSYVEQTACVRIAAVTPVQNAFKVKGTRNQHPLSGL